MSPTIRDIPAGQRPRERLSRMGPEALTDAELIGLVLGSGRSGATATQLAEELLADCGGIDRLRTADLARLTRHPGIGPAKAVALQAAFALGRRTQAPASVAGSQDVVDLVAPLIADAPTERVAAVFLDGAHRVLRVQVVSGGSAGRSIMPVREILGLALRLDASAVAVAHNHPDGDPSPSAADLAATQTLADAAAAVGLRLVDHVVLAGASWRSIGTARENPTR